MDGYACYSVGEFKDLLEDGDTHGGHWQLQEKLEIPWCRIFWRDPGPGSCSSNYQLANKFLLVLQHMESIYILFNGLIQFWVPREVGSCRLYLTTTDQPFAIRGELKKEVCKYRKHCMGYDYSYLEEDGDDKESWGSIGRVFNSGLPESSPDVRLYLDKEHPLREFVARCSDTAVYHSVFPIFDNLNGTYKPAVAVLELFGGLSVRQHYDCIKAVEEALEKSNFTIDVIPSTLPREVLHDEVYEFRELFGSAIASVPELHLAQLWVPCHQSTNNYNKVDDFIYMERSYFWAVDCIEPDSHGYADYTIVDFLFACKLHKVKSNIWNIGHALLPAKSSFFCRNIGELSILVHPLAHFAQRAGLSFCFAVCLRNRKDKKKSRVVEFFLQFDSRQHNSPFPILKFLLEIIDSKLVGYELSSGQSIGMEMPVEVSTKSNVLITPVLLSQYAQSTGRSSSKEQMVIGRMVESEVRIQISTITSECSSYYNLKMFLEYLDYKKEGGVKKIVWKKWDKKDPTYRHFIFSSLETGSLLECPSHEHSLLSPIDEIQQKIKFLLSKIATELEASFTGYIIQFWAVKKCDDKLHLVTKEYPFVIGNPTKGLWEYRKKSMDHQYILNEGTKEEELGPLGRVFRSNYPERTSNLHVYSTKEFPLRNYAVQCGMKSYMAFPVMSLNQDECVGVLEYITPLWVSEKMEISFKEANLRAIHIISQTWENFPNDRKYALNEVNEMMDLAKNIPHIGYARLWIKCNQCDNEKCVQLVKERSAFYMSHKEISTTGTIGTLLASGSKFCFFPNVCDFNITEEQGILEARQSRMSVCLAICLRSSYTGDALYFLEFFLDQGCRRGENFLKFLRYLLPIMDETLKSFIVSSGKKLGKELEIEVVTFGNISEFSLLESQEANIPPIRFKIFKHGEEINGEQSNDQVVHNDFNSTADSVECEQYKDSSMPLYDAAAIQSKKRGRQNKKGSFNITIQDLQPHFGKKLHVVEKELGVSRSTIKRVCRENGIPRWPSNPINKGNISLFLTPNSNDDVRSSKAQDLEGSRNQNPPSTRTDFHDCLPRTNSPLHQPFLGTNTRECSRNCTKLTEDDVVFTKVTLKDETVKIKINISTKLEELKQEVASRLDIENGSFKLKYMDESRDWISLLCDEDLEIAMEQMLRELEDHKLLQLESERDVFPPPSLIVRVEEELRKDNQPSQKHHPKEGESKESAIPVEDYAVDSNNEQEKISEYCGRRDYAGRNQLDAMDQQLIDSFIDGNFTGRRSQLGWCDNMALFFNALLFNESINGDVIDFYLKILCSEQYREHHAISQAMTYLSTYATRYIVSLLKDDSATYPKTWDQYISVIRGMKAAVCAEVCGLLEHIKSDIHYIVVPIYDEQNHHWYMLIMDLQKKQMYARNSIWGARSQDVERRMSNFLIGLLRCMRHHIPTDIIEPIRDCRQQETGSMDCGVFVSLWSECYLRDSEEFLAEEAYVDIKGYRARMACTILKHSSN